MFNLFYFIAGKHPAIDKMLKNSTPIHPKIKPTQLIKELKKVGFSKMNAKLNQKPGNPLLALRKLTLLHYIVIHSPELAGNFEPVTLKIETEDQWLNENIIIPYSIFLYKVIHEREIYCECKSSGRVETSFRIAFYAINMLKDLFQCVRKMCYLSRYYLKVEKQLKTSLTTEYIYMIAYQAQELYNCLKNVLEEMVACSQEYITGFSERDMLKCVIYEELPKINEDMKNLFLDKYYCPYNKGFGVKLLKEEMLVEKNPGFMEILSKTNYKAQATKVRKMKKLMTLDKFLFGDKGHLNQEVIQNLSSWTQIRVTDDAIRSTRMAYLEDLRFSQISQTYDTIRFSQVSQIDEIGKSQISQSKTDDTVGNSQIVQIDDLLPNSMKYPKDIDRHQTEVAQTL